jgi:LPS export ABC transporter permease LptG
VPRHGLADRRAPWLGLFGRVILRAIAIQTALAAAAGIVLFLAVDSVEVFNKSPDEASAIDLLLLQLWSVPAVLQQIAALVVLIGTSSAIVGLVRRGEVGAVLAAGGSPMVVLRPAFVAGGVLAIAYASFVEWVGPKARAESYALRRKLGLPAGASELQGQAFRWFGGADYTFRVDVLEDADGALLGGVLVLRLGGGKLLERWDLDRLRFEGDRWVGENGLYRRFSGESEVESRTFERTDLPLPERPEDFARSIGTPEQLPYFSLVETTRARERLAQPTTLHRFELYRRHAYPIALWAAVLLGASLAMILGKRASLGLGLAAGATAGFGFWVLDELGVTLGNTGALSPEISAHLAAGALMAAGAVALVVVRGRGLRA